MLIERFHMTLIYIAHFMDTFFELSGLNYQWETIFLQIVVQLELQKYLGTM